MTVDKSTVITRLSRKMLLTMSTHIITKKPSYCHVNLSILFYIKTLLFYEMEITPSSFWIFQSNTKMLYTIILRRKLLT